MGHVLEAPLLRALPSRQELAVIRDGRECDLVLLLIVHRHSGVTRHR
jgi:hypothetical protein